MPQPYHCGMVIGLDAAGSFAATAEASGFESSALAATVVPADAESEIAAWTQARLRAWQREDIGELHAADLGWPERREICEMLGSRGDVHGAVIVTDNLLLRGAEGVRAHRGGQLHLVEANLAQADSDDGNENGERIRRLLAGLRVGQSRLNDCEYVMAATVPLAVAGAAQRAFCFHAGDEWRAEMTELRLVMDEDTPAAVRYVSGSLLPILGGDNRFQWILPEHWLRPPEHPLLAQARHPDGDGLRPQRIVGDTIEWASSHDEPAVQVADVLAWTVRRTISHPNESIARECFELLRSVLTGEGGRCFELFSIGSIPSEAAAIYAHLHSAEQPKEWLVRSAAA